MRNYYHKIGERGGATHCVVNNHIYTLKIDKNLPKLNKKSKCKGEIDRNTYTHFYYF